MFKCSEHQILLVNPKIYINNNNDGENYPHLISQTERVGRDSEVPAMKFLSIYIDPALCFNFDIKQILNKIARSM